MSVPSVGTAGRAIPPSAPRLPAPGSSEASTTSGAGDDTGRRGRGVTSGIDAGTPAARGDAYAQALGAALAAQAGRRAPAPGEAAAGGAAAVRLRPDDSYVAYQLTRTPPTTATTATAQARQSPLESGGVIVDLTAPAPAAPAPYTAPAAGAANRLDLRA